MAGLKTILFIEDDHFISDMYARVLTKAGYEVTVVSNGQEGVDIAKTGNYDLVLLDIMLPELDGTQVLTELRGDDRSGLPNSKIIIMTNFDEPDEVRIAIEAKADGYLIKADTTPSALIEIIQKLDQ